jgi:hypothetical protein
MSKQKMLTRLTLLALAVSCLMSGGVLWAQQKAPVPRKQSGATRLDRCIHTARDRSAGLKRLVDTLHSSGSRERPAHLKQIVERASDLLASVKSLHGEISGGGKAGTNVGKAGASAGKVQASTGRANAGAGKLSTSAARVGANVEQQKFLARNLASLVALVDGLHRGLQAGSTDFTANCGESGDPCLEAVCAACCRGRVTDPQAVQDCQQYCSAQAALCQALDILRETEEKNSQNVKAMTNI